MICNQYQINMSLTHLLRGLDLKCLRIIVWTSQLRNILFYEEFKMNGTDITEQTFSRELSEWAMC